MAKSMVTLIAPIVFIGSLFSQTSNGAIFGADDRAYTHGTSTAIAILNTMYEPSSPGNLKIAADNVGKYICPTERFSNDPSLAYACTGFLVAPDLIATAGHCMVNTGESRNETETYCQAYSWLFDFDSDGSDGPRLSDFPAEKLYHCKQVVYAINEEQAPFRDFALVQLDRPVTDRSPYTLDTSLIAVGSSLTMIGYPLGTPAKLSRTAKVLRNNLENQILLTNLDAFEGNSGSPVFNAKGAVIGILVGGMPSTALYKPQGRSCEIYNVCNENGENCARPETNISSFPNFQGIGSEVQRINPLAEVIQRFQKPRMR